MMHYILRDLKEIYLILKMFSGNGYHIETMNEKSLYYFYYFWTNASIRETPYLFLWVVSHDYYTNSIMCCNKLEVL